MKSLIFGKNQTHNKLIQAKQVLDFQPTYLFLEHSITKFQELCRTRTNTTKYLKPIYYILHKLRLVFLNRALKKNNREKRVVSYSMANRIGIIYENACKETPVFLKQLVKKFSDDQKQTQVLVYYSSNREKEKTDSTQNKNCFSSSDFSFFMKPKKEKLKEFIDQKFDILLDLTSHLALTAKYIAAVSQASYKVGSRHEDYIDIYDLILHVKDSSTASELAECAMHYLSIIKTKEENDQ